jgi:hypothetical protein
MLPHQVDHPLEQLKLIFGCAHAAPDDHTLPGPDAKGGSNDSFHVVAAVEAKQTGSTDTVLSEPGHSRLDRVCYRLRIPRPGNPERIEADHEHTRVRSRCIHFHIVGRGGRRKRLLTVGSMC